MKTEDFAKLPTVTLHLLKIEILGNRKPIIFTSKDDSKLTEKLIALESLYGVDAVCDNSIEITQHSYEVKDTFEVDENYVYNGLSSFRGVYL